VKTRVKDLMVRPAVVVAPHASLREVAEVLSAEHVSGVPVVRDGNILGVVSAADIVEKERGPDEESQGFVSRHRHRHRTPAAYAVTAGEAMSSPPVVVDAWMSAYEAAWLMSVHDVARLPVVDRGELVGVISRTDLVRHFARADAEIAHDIELDVVEALPVPDVVVHVENGEVVLEGEVDRQADLECLPHAVARVAGVVAVRSHVTLRVPTTEPVVAGTA
jgi:CBS domain-containing protein